MKKKTIEFDNLDIEKIEEFSTENKIATFSETIRYMVRNFNSSPSISDDNFALIADALVQLNEKIDILISNIEPPKSAGEVK